MGTVPAAPVMPGEERVEDLPERVREALGELAGAAKEGLLALSVGVGLGVPHERMEAEVDEVVGPKGRHDPGRSAVRHGHEGGQVTLGGRRVPVSRPQVRGADGASEVELATYRRFAARDQLRDRVGADAGGRLDAPLRAHWRAGRQRGRRARAIDEPVGGLARVRLAHARAADRLMSRPLADLRLAVLMLDGIELKGRCCVVALGIDTDRVRASARGDGSTENATVATTLLANLVERGLDVEQGVLVVIDGAKALRKAVRDVLGVHTPVRRCIRHKERNALEHLPERDRSLVRRRLRAAWALDDHDRALDQLRALAGELAHTHPGAAASLREGMEETLTVTRLGVRGRLKRTVASTNPCESMIETVRRVARKRQALAERRHVPALDGRRDARSRAPVPQDHRPRRPRQARPHGRT
jgi:putative transposase